MANLNINTGLEEVTLNDKVTVWLNFSDADFVARVALAMEEIGDIHDKCASYVSGENVSGKEMYDAFKKADAEIRERINALLGADVCTPLFGAISVMALSEGLPIWCNLMIALAEMVNIEMEKQSGKATLRVDKYTRKYMKK